MKNDRYVFFWGGIFSQWYDSTFKIDGVEYNNCEQYMMAEKARFFKDWDILKNILNEKSPKKQKAFGRKVKGFDSNAWDKVKKEIVFKGNYHKFTQNSVLMKELLKTDGKLLVEASPYDTIWGIGMDSHHPDILESTKWKGQNLLGIILVRVRNLIKDELEIHKKIESLSLIEYPMVSSNPLKPMEDSYLEIRKAFVLGIKKGLEIFGVVK